ncbi:putative la-type HTH domain, winged helix-like DNA-binding domain superfamily [Helianthus annuus]|nr:putative la-type HTH domain, winged helix-like DNA-binding domain superfamily [Helianthus annuus]
MTSDSSTTSASPAPRSPSASPLVTEQTLGFSDHLTVPEPQTAAHTVENNLEGSESSNGDGESSVKKSPWSKPSVNGVVDGSSSPVMGAAAWPALSELSRPLPKSLSFQSESSSKTASDGSGSATVSQAPVTSQAPQKPGKTNTSHHSNQNHTHPGRQRSMKRGVGAGVGYNRLPPPPPPMPPYPLYTTPYGGFVPAVLDAPVREQAPYNGSSFVPARPVSGIGSHSHPGHDHPFNRKRNNFGPRPRGDGGPYVNNGPGGRRDHNDREWFGPRSHGGVIPHPAVPPPPPPPRGYMPQAHLGPAPFIAPQPIRPYGAPMVYEMPPPPPPFVYVQPPIIPHASPSTNIPSLSDTILRQIEYYFSDANLVKDHYLRSNMDEEGWVPLTLIAGFHRVKSLTSDLQMVLSSIRDSTIVEVQGETVRRRNDWRKWIKPSVNITLDSGSQSPHATTDGSIIQPSLEKLSLDGSSTTEERTTDKELSASIKPDNGEVTFGDEFTNPKSSTT